MRNVSVEWGNEERTIIWTSYLHGWTWDDLYAAAEKAHQMTESVEHPVDMLIDFRTGERIPAGAFSQFNRLKDIQHPRWAFQVILARSGFVATLVNIYSKVNPDYQYRVASTAEDARAILAERHQHVPEL